MFRSALSKVMWVGRATVFLVGLAVILAMVMGLASAALSATGDNFILGQPNSADAPTTLVGKIVDTTKSALVLKNPNGGSALQLQVDGGVAPLKVNAAAGKATNLDADKVDGQEASSFLPANAKAADSDTLDDIDSTGFVRSQANALDMAPGVNNGEVLRFFNPNVILDIDVFYSCPSNLSNNGSLNIVNRSSSETINVFSDNGGDNPNAYTRLGPLQNFAQDAAASGEHITLQAQGAHHMATIEVFSVHRASALGTGTDNKCHVEAQGLFSQGFFTQ
jgi:hypothetical protein